MISDAEAPETPRGEWVRSSLRKPDRYLSLAGNIQNFKNSASSTKDRGVGGVEDSTPVAPVGG